MIYIERGPAPLPPNQLRQIEIARERLLAEVHSLKQQQRVQFKAHAWQLYRPALNQVFQGKCAFCESPVGITSPGTIEQFYPKALYPERAYDWTNLYLACQLCNVNKGATDPIDRVTQELWLLDPCADRPEEFLFFAIDGTVMPRPEAAKDKQRRADRTIAILGLNRIDLVLERRRTIESVLRIADESPTSSELKSLLSPASRYSAAAQSAFSAIKSEKSVPRLEPVLRHRTPVLPRLHPTFIRRIEIEGFRLAKSIDLQLELGTSRGPDDAPEPGWLVLLGENATGKTTVLQAVALALMGNRYTKKWPKRLLSIGNFSEGYVRVHLSTDQMPIEVVFDDNGPRFVSGHEGARTVIRGYGAVRITSRRQQRRAHPAQWVDNLFDERAELADPNAWAASLDQKSLNAFGYASKDLLALPNDAAVEVRNGRLEIQTQDGPVPYEDHSSGYRDMVSLLADLTAAARNAGINDPSYAHGIVLLDELGTHLHPRWRMEIVVRLRRAFRGMQFLATTHEPLCLRGLKQNEVALLRRERDDVHVETDLPDPAGLRVDQLLTSRLFGLHSTIDQAIDRQFQRYYALLATHEPTEADKAEITQLRQELRKYTVLGYTRRDQLAYEFIDDFLAREPALDVRARQELKEETRRKVQDLWAMASFAVKGGK